MVKFLTNRTEIQLLLTSDDKLIIHGVPFSNTTPLEHAFVVDAVAVTKFRIYYAPSYFENA